MPVIESTNQQLYSFLLEGEGPKFHIYFDSIAKLTVGIGHMLGGTRTASVQGIKDDAHFIHRRFGFYLSGSRAAESDIEARIDQLLSIIPEHPRSHRADYWADKPSGTTQVQLNQQGMVALKHYDSQLRISGLCSDRNWPGRQAMASLPINVQIVIVDIAFNAGVGALSRQSNYRTFREAIDSRNFRLAASIVASGGLRISTADRNRRRAELLRG